MSGGTVRAKTVATFDELYPDAPLWFQPPHGADDDGAAKCPTVGPCWNCGTATAYVDLDFEGHLCSEGCRDVKWGEYFAALRNRGESEDAPPSP